jgi:hypothetical protein
VTTTSTRWPWAAASSAFRRAPRRLIVLAGSGRSGTTWLGDILSSCRGCGSVFEPLNANRVPEAPQWGRASGSPGCYLRREEPNPAWSHFFDRVFSGQVSNAWTRQDWRLVPQAVEHRPVLSRVFFGFAKVRRLMRNWTATTYVVKTIRSNLLLPWLATWFPVQIVHLIRHPCAVIDSQLRLGWRSELDDIHAQPALLEDLLSPFSHWLESASAPFEKLAVLWCVENLLPLEMVSRGLCQPIVYEECVAHPESELPRLLGDLHMTPTSATWRAIGTWVSAPSRAGTEKDACHPPLTLPQRERVMEIVHGFGIHIEGASSRPLTNST